MDTYPNLVTYKIAGSIAPVSDESGLSQLDNVLVGPSVVLIVTWSAGGGGGGIGDTHMT